MAFPHTLFITQLSLLGCRNCFISQDPFVLRRFPQKVNLLPKPSKTKLLVYAIALVETSNLFYNIIEGALLVLVWVLLVTVSLNMLWLLHFAVLRKLSVKGLKMLWF